MNTQNYIDLCEKFAGQARKDGHDAPADAYDGIRTQMSALNTYRNGMVQLHDVIAKWGEEHPELTEAKALLDIVSAYIEEVTRIAEGEEYEIHD